MRLTRKFADFIDGVDLRHCRVGDLLDIPRHEAEILLAEDWAAPADHRVRHTADDAQRRPPKPSKD